MLFWAAVRLSVPIEFLATPRSTPGWIHDLTTRASGIGQAPLVVAASGASRLRAALEPRETPDSHPRISVARRLETPTSIAWGLGGERGGDYGFQADVTDGREIVAVFKPLNFQTATRVQPATPGKRPLSHAWTLSWAHAGDRAAEYPGTW